MIKPITKRVETDRVLTIVGRHYFTAYCFRQDRNYSKPIIMWWSSDGDDGWLDGKNEAGFSSTAISNNHKIGLIPSGNGYYVPGRHD